MRLTDVIGKRFYFSSILIVLALAVSCKKKENDIIPPDEADTIELLLDLNQRFQTISNFGASDAWSTQFAGKNWPESKRTKMADLLFSTEMDQEGNPVGIGLSSWRFNIGGGSAEQGSDSQISDEWRRAECFLDADEAYDWNKQEGQQWFLREAKARGVGTFVGFVNSPPVVYTKNKKAWSGDGFSTNLSENNYSKYAEFLSNVVKGIAANTGVNFDYISPLNEPQWEWKCCSQEGSPWNNNEIAEIVTIIDSVFRENNIPSKIELTDAGQIDYLFETVGNPNRSNQIKNFFDPSSQFYIGDLPTVANKISGHSYWTTWDLDWLVRSRQSLRQRIDAVDPTLEYWMSEYTLLEDNEEIKGGGRDLGIDPALYMARVIHGDLTIANANAWQWWLAISPYDYKDGLIYIDHNKFDGNIYESKMLWALGHYSRFIRPGMQRIEIRRSTSQSISQSLEGLMESAFVSESGDQIVVVFVNYQSVDEKVQFVDLPAAFKTIKIYQTTAMQGEDLSLVPSTQADAVIDIPKKGMVTCVFSL